MSLGMRMVGAALLGAAVSLAIDAERLVDPAAAEQAKLAIKRGQPRAAVSILRDGFDSLRAQAGAQEPSVGSVSPLGSWK